MLGLILVLGVASFVAYIFMMASLPFQVNIMKEHEHATKTSTPKKEHHPPTWWIKWIASVIIVFAMIATTNDLYPWNMFLQFLGVAGWLWVAIVWNDRALIVVNAVACAIFINGMVMYFVKVIG